jgi:hypothetical protein
MQNAPCLASRTGISVLAGRIRPFLIFKCELGRFLPGQASRFLKGTFAGPIKNPEGKPIGSVD